MKIEDIEKEAQMFACETKRDAEGIINIQNGFKAGANWRINSVWHDAGETPRPHKNAVVQTKEYGALLLGPDMDETTYKWLCKTIGITSWAYIEDLLPNMEK